MKISIIVAYADQRVIGAENKLLWHLPDDLKNFKKITLGHMIVMGRKTWESIGRPLPGRTNSVISRDKGLKIDKALVFYSLEEAIEYAKQNNEQEIFIIGGEQIYRLAFPLADKLYLTRIHGSFEGDAYFPEIDPDQWRIDSKTIHPADEKHPYAFEMRVLSRKE
jgi:dihydrofolate reductase